MADILKVTTPLVNKNQAVQPKPGVEPLTPFNVSSTTKVIQPHNQSELLKQNTGLLEGNEGATILMDLLKDPAVTVSYLKNIFLLEEIFKLLPANNTTLTPEIEQMFQTLMMDSGDIASEMVRQENDSTMFKGEFFDFLRELSDNSPPNSEVQRGVANLLRAVNNLMCKEDILDGVANNLQFLAENLSSSKELYPRLIELMERFRSKHAGSNFPQLKGETLALLKEVEDSILFTPKLSKILSITIYNLSRYNDSPDYLNEAAFYLRQLLSGPQRQQLISYLDQLMRALREETTENSNLKAPRPKSAHSLDAFVTPDGQIIQEPTDRAGSKVMETLTKLIGKESTKQPLSTNDESKMEGILHSLLSSPCNFTPLLHFIVPAFFQDIKAFAEIWINPDSDEKDMPPGAGRGKHFLLVIDVETLGQFEAELFVHDKIIDVSLFCPPGCEQLFSGLAKDLPKQLTNFSYRVGKVKLDTLEKPRSLMDVFKSLPYKRVGVDVKI